jgi:hypothetical protein
MEDIWGHRLTPTFHILGSYNDLTECGFLHDTVGVDVLPVARPEFWVQDVERWPKIFRTLRDG